MKLENPPGIAVIVCTCVLASILTVLMAGVVESVLLGNFVSTTMTLTWGEIVGAIFISPLAETLLFQGLPYVVFHERLSSFSCVPLMSIPFAFAHLYSGYAVVLSSALAGVVLASVFLLANKRSGKTAIWATTLTHTLHNCLTLLLSTGAGGLIVQQ